MKREDRGQEVPRARRIADALLREFIEPRPLSSRTRTGRAFFIDTFENYTAVITEKWKSSTGGTTVSLDTDYPKHNLQCMKLTTGVAENDNAAAILYLGCFPLGRFGIEFEFFSSAGAANIRKLYTDFRFYDGTTLRRGAWYWLGEANKKWQYMNSAGAYADISGASQDVYIESTKVPFYHNVKMLIDFKKNKYIKLLCDDKKFDMSTLAIYSAADASAPSFDCWIGITNAAAGTARTAYIDNVILTDMEP